MGNWDNLSLTEKAAMIRVAVKNGIINLQDIKREYNEFAKGGSIDTDWSYNSWKRQIAEHMGIKPDEDSTYDYEAYFNKYPEEAWKMLKGDPTAHFTDEFKTVYHPTFSTYSKYNGNIDSKFNPQGLVGGTWSKDNHTFTMSPDGYRGPVSMDDRKWYLENAEDNGVQLREADGSLPVYDDIPWGGVLPNVTVYGNKHAEGGNIYDGTSKPSNKMRKSGATGNTLKSTFLDTLNQSLREDNRFDSSEFRRLFTELADMESSYRPTITNSIGAKGYFQLMPSNRSASWSNPTQQFHEMYDLVGNNLNYLNKHLTKKDWERASQLGIDTYGLLAGAHLGGVGNVVKALRGKGNAKDMNGSSVIGYMTKFSQNGLSRPITVGDVSIPMVQDIPEFIPLNSQAFNTTLPTYQRPELTLEEHVVQETPVSPYSPEEIDRQERMNRLSAFNRILGLTNPYPQEDNSFLSTIRLITGNTFSKGGKIHIDPSKKGTFTAAASKHGMGVQEFASKVLANKENYSPAMVKKANFARNARKWKHGLGGNLFDGITEDSQQMYIAKPDATYTVKQPAIFPIKPDLSTDAVLARTNKVYSNYSQAKDAPLTKFQETQRNVRRYFKDNILGIVPAGISNCTLTATQWIDPTNPVKNAASITHNPEKYNYSPIKEEEILPGNLLITKHPKKESYHTMLVSGFTEEDGTYNFNGKKYKYKKGEPLLTYSRGGRDTSFITKDIPLSVYIKNSDGKTQQHFYKYNKNKTLLPEVVVTNK